MKLKENFKSCVQAVYMIFLILSLDSVLREKEEQISVFT